jgi:hypothetical protein
MCDPPRWVSRWRPGYPFFSFVALYGLEHIVLASRGRREATPGAADLKAERPGEREGRFWRFCLGAAAYAVILFFT